MKTIDTGKVEMIAFLLPEGYNNLKILSALNIVEYCHNNIVHTIDLAPSIGREWIPLDLLSQMTEEKMKLVMPIKTNLKYYDRTDFVGYMDFGERHPDGNPYWFGHVKDSFDSLCQLHKLWLVNPYQYKGEKNIDPKGEVWVSYDNGQTWSDEVEWQYKRRCMMAGIAGGNGYFGEGWGTTGSNGCDRGLISDPPDFYRYVDDEELWEEAQQHVGDYFLLYKDK